MALMKKQTMNLKKIAVFLTSLLFLSGLFLNSVRQKDVDQTHGEASYVIDMTKDNAPTSANYYTNAENTIRYSTFEYIGVKASPNNHVELKETGYFGNKNNSQITSITSIKANFTTLGSLTLATSFDGINYTQTTITSGVTNYTSSLPYHFRLTANSSAVTILSVTITYSCAPHATPIGNEETYNITVNDFTVGSTGTDISNSLNNNLPTYFTSDLTLTSVTGTKIYGNATNATNFKMGSSSAVGTITFNFASMKVSQVIVSAYKYSTDTVSIKVTTSADSTGKTISIPASTPTNYTYALNDASNATSLTIEGVGKRFHLEGIKIISAGAGNGNAIETGFYASDAKALNYKVNDVYATANEINATASMTSGVPLSLSYNANGVDGYNYVLKNASNEVISATTPFPSVGKYYITISYKVYAPITIELTVSVAPTITLTSLSAVDAKTTYNIGEIYDDVNELVVTATYSDNSKNVINYDPTGANGYTIYALDPNADDFYTANPFSVPGYYVLTVTYQGIESNDVDFKVLSPAGEVNEATINVLTNTVADSTAINDPQLYLSAMGVTISGATASNVYGGAGAAKLRFSSSKNSGSLTINFANNVLITSVALNVSEYNTSDTINIQVATSANTTGQNMTLSMESATLTYDAFNSDTTPSSSITISSPSGNRFFLYGITLGIGPVGPALLTGVSLKTATEIAPGGVETLIPTFTPSNVNPLPTLSWTSDNPGIASVNDGKVTGVALGTTTIRVSATQGDLTFNASTSVTVSVATNYTTKTMVHDYQDYMDYNYYNNVDSSPSKGNVNFLVIPVELQGYPMSEATRTRIEKAYFGTESDTGWHSVKSFYEEESNGRLNISGTVAPIYKTTYGNTITEAQTTTLVTTATNWYISNYSTNSGKEFDADSDGYIDSVILVYSAPNNANNNDNLWAYCFWTDNARSTTAPTAKTFFWASYDFMDESPNATIDAHTYIHETGHLLGLDDYYNYDRASSYGAAGGFNMQDFNVGEHDPYSRVALGWIDPIVPTGNTTLTITPGQAIILSHNDLSASSPFDEYLILDVYSPTGLNEFDATYKYGGNSSMYPKGPNVTGIRVWHVDARLMRNYTTSSAPTLTSTITAGSKYTHAMSNSTDSVYGSKYSSYRDYKLLHLLQEGGTNTYKTGGQFSASDVWVTGDTFSMASYASFFVNSGRLNSNLILPYSFEVAAINGTSVTISITKN